MSYPHLSEQAMTFDTSKLISLPSMDDADHLQDMNDDVGLFFNGEDGDQGSGKYSLLKYCPYHC